MYFFKSLIASFIAAVFIVFLSSTAHAGEYDIPVVVDGETYTVTVSVEDGNVITATSVITSVAIGPIVDLSPKRVISSTWANLLDIDPEDYLSSEDKFTGDKFFRIPFGDVEDWGQRSVEDVYYLLLVPYVGVTESGSVGIRIGIWAGGSDLIGDPYSMKATSDIALEVNADGERFRVSIPARDIKHETDTSTAFRETYAADISGADALDALTAIALADDASMRIRGSKGSVTVEISEHQMAYIKTTIVIYAKLGGKME